MSYILKWLGVDINEDKIRTILKINHHIFLKKGTARPLNMSIKYCMK